MTMLFQHCQIENAIECMKLDGTIAKFHEKWFGIKPAPGSAEDRFTL